MNDPSQNAEAVLAPRRCTKGTTGFGRRLRAAIEAKGVNQTRIAEAADSHQTIVSRWLRDDGEPTFAQLLKLCDLLGVTLDEALRDEGDPRAVERPSEAEALVVVMARTLGLAEATRRLVKP